MKELLYYSIIRRKEMDGAGSSDEEKEILFKTKELCDIVYDNLFEKYLREKSEVNVGENSFSFPLSNNTTIYTKSVSYLVIDSDSDILTKF